MSTAYGAGGIISAIYLKYGTYIGNIDVFYSSIDPGSRTGVEYAFKWEDNKGFHSDQTAKGLQYIQFDFKRPFIFDSYKFAMIKGFRFQLSWKVEARYKSGPYKIVHENNDKICTEILNYDCNLFTSKLFKLDPQNVTLCDSIKITATSKDTKNTDCLTIGAIEFYEQNKCTIIKKHNTISYCNIFLLLITTQKM